MSDAAASNPKPGDLPSLSSGPLGIPSAELQQLWFACMRKEWSSLVVIPAASGQSANRVARALVDVGTLLRVAQVKLIQAEGMNLGATSRLIVEMTTQVGDGGLAVVSIDPVLDNQAGIPVALAADAALLCVRLGETDLSAARRTVEMIGRDRFLGAVTLKPVP